MLLRYFYNRQLAQASYLVGCQATGEAIVIDPARDVDQYIEAARREGLQIVAAVETHIHADFLSGARELAELVGAHLYLSDEGDENWKYTFAPRYAHTLLKDGDTFRVGRIRFSVMHTPGHTPEHISLLLTDTAASDVPMGIFTGDFVFVGSVGRPDLLEKAAGMQGTAEVGARQMFRALQRFRQLPDYVQVWPAHGAGSACGKGLGAVPSSTVGYEKLVNPGLQFDDEDAFVRWLLSDQPVAPRYFAIMKRLNKEERPVLRGVPRVPQVSLDTLADAHDNGAVIIDTRLPQDFAPRHIRGSFNIPLTDGFATWAGSFLPYDRDLYLIAGPSQVEEATRALINIGLDRIRGYVPPTIIDEWEAAGYPMQQYGQVYPPQVVDAVVRGEVTVVDVRTAPEVRSTGLITGAIHIDLNEIATRLAEIPTDKPVLVYCQSGARSAVAAAVLQAYGVDRVSNLLGGMMYWARFGMPVERPSWAMNVTLDSYA